MNIEQIERMAHHGDVGKAACAIRLRAARQAVGLTQKQVADAVSRRATTISNMESGLSLPSNELLRYFFRNYRIDFNFMMYGAASGLPADVLERLAPQLEAANNEWDQRERLNRAQSKPQSWQQKTT